ncbi:MAG: DUF2867 domain-containing protein, partial [Bacteroidales bacterium]|nr:DUF2867 domain-containing protein [Bacteroidales bacterium]
MVGKIRMEAIRKHNTAPESSMITVGFGKVDYCDVYRITKSTNESPEQIAVLLFDVPKWVECLMSLRNWIVRPFGLKTKTENNSTAIFPVIDRNDNEMLMGMNDKHLNFRLSILIDREKSFIYVTTVVHCNNIWGKMYFLLIKPFHKIIVHAMIKRQ